MKYFLLEYDKAAGKVVRRVEFAQLDDAMHERFRREAESLSDALEIVVLGARDERDLARTHARYFKSVRELSESLPAGI